MQLYHCCSAVQWPAGRYGLPMPKSGCPGDGAVNWKTGWTYHDTEDDSNENQRSEIYHMPGNFTRHGIQQKFCIKEDAAGVSEFWPEGKYCIYKKGNDTGITAMDKLFHILSHMGNLDLLFYF